MRRTARVAFTLGVMAALSMPLQAQVRLLGLTGNHQLADPVATPNTSLFEINLEDASSTLIENLTHIPDGHVIAFNPNQEELIYHFGGSEAWTDDPAQSGGDGFRDHQYLETYNLNTGVISPIFNANPPPSPDELPSHGLEAPIPDFVAPGGIRLIENPAPRENGENEYRSLRGLTWSSEENLWYATDEKGLYTVSASGEPTFIGQPVEDSRNLKGIVWYEDAEGNKQLLAGTRRNASLWTLDPATGAQIDDPVLLQVPEGSESGFAFEGVLGMAQHPDTGVLYGIRRISGNNAAFNRELITIDPSSGATTLVGNLGLHLSSLAFVYSAAAPGDFNGDGLLDAADIDELTANLGGSTAYDLNGDGTVDDIDRVVWVNELKNTWFGDSNLDGEFSSRDLVQIFTAGEYEDDIEDNSSWGDGDWNGDGDFGSSDLVTAFIEGGYEIGPRAAVTAVPEPSGLALLFVGLAGAWRRRP